MHEFPITYDAHLVLRDRILSVRDDIYSGHIILPFVPITLITGDKPCE